MVCPCPGLKVVSPYTAADAKGLLKSAIRDPNPVVFLENELLYGTSFEVPEGDYTIPLGKGRIAREGTDVTITAFSIMVEKSLKAAEILAQKGISVEVIDLRTYALGYGLNCGFSAKNKPLSISGRRVAHQWN